MNPILLDPETRTITTRQYTTQYPSLPNNGRILDVIFVGYEENQKTKFCEAFQYLTTKNKDQLRGSNDVYYVAQQITDTNKSKNPKYILKKVFTQKELNDSRWAQMYLLAHCTFSSDASNNEKLIISRAMYEIGKLYFLGPDEETFGIVKHNKDIISIIDEFAYKFFSKNQIYADRWLEKAAKLNNLDACKLLSDTFKTDTMEREKSLEKAAYYEQRANEIIKELNYLTP